MQIVLVEPEIPQNTGSIARTCAATNTPLHLVGKLGFELDEKRIRRAGLDYWPWVNLTEHESWESFTTSTNPQNIWLLSKFGERSYWDASFAPGDALVFGSETKGLPSQIKEHYPAPQLLRIPMENKNVRSLNLSNAVSLVLYEGLRQQAQREVS